jgi:hypothetical protein
MMNRIQKRCRTLAMPWLASILVVVGFALACAGPAHAFYVSKTVTAQNTYSDTIAPKIGNGFLGVSISGNAGSTVTLQRSYDNGTTWKDVGSYVADVEGALFDESYGVLYRIGVKTGDYVAGTIILMLIN